MKYTEKDLYKGMKLRCTDNGFYDFWKKGAIYTVEENSYGSLVIRGEGDRSNRPTYDILNYLNGKTLVKMEIVEEEKEMKKYAKITKYAGLIDTDKENGLEIGKEYEIVKFSSVSEDCWVYLNDKRPEYFITETQYELVEREYPVAEIKVDILATLEAKIEQLKNEQDNLYNKRKRIEKQEEALYDKRMRLIEAKEAFEFLKQQKFL
ncbi:hypothetical protein EF326P1_00014 [Enterococcus phage EF326P1]|nr:hypothetical protein EF326P1_00014 [Enterococcus phage EF326P1]